MQRQVMKARVNEKVGNFCLRSCVAYLNFLKNRLQGPNLGLFCFRKLLAHIEVPYTTQP